MQRDIIRLLKNSNFAFLHEIIGKTLSVKLYLPNGIKFVVVIASGFHYGSR